MYNVGGRVCHVGGRVCHVGGVCHVWVGWGGSCRGMGCCEEGVGCGKFH